MENRHESMESVDIESKMEDMIFLEKRNGEQASKEEYNDDKPGMESLGLNPDAQKIIRQLLSKGEKANEKKKSKDITATDCVLIEACVVLGLRRSKVPKFSQIVESVLTPLLNITQHH